MLDVKQLVRALGQGSDVATVKGSSRNGYDSGRQLVAQFVDETDTFGMLSALFGRYTSVL